MNTVELSDRIRDSVVSILTSQGIDVGTVNQRAAVNGSTSLDQFCPAFAVDIGEYEIRATAIDRGKQRVWTLYAWQNDTHAHRRLDNASARRFVDEVVPLIETMYQKTMDRG